MIKCFLIIYYSDYKISYIIHVIKFICFISQFLMLFHSSLLNLCINYDCFRHTYLAFKFLKSIMQREFTRKVQNHE